MRRGRAGGRGNLSARVLVIIPARGGSKRIPRKNLLPVAGAPLLTHSVRHALEAGRVDEVVVSTDDEGVAAVARGLGVEVVMRPPELGADTATSESALLHVLDQRRSQGDDDPELVVFLQCTSPVRRAGDIDAAITMLETTGSDAVFSAVRDRALYWSVGSEGPQPINYDPTDRLREQDMGVQMRENGSIYVVRTDRLRATGNRLAGRRAVYEMDVWSSFQVDAPEDLAIVEWILSGSEFRPDLPWPDPIELVVFDFDGVMTDNTVLVTEDGGEAVRCNRGDGWGVQKMREAGVEMMVLSTEAHPVVSARARKLKLPVLQGIADKRHALVAELDRRGVDPGSVVYLGNDENDVDCFALVGLAVAVGDAHPSALGAADLVLSHRGGDGAVRELCDLVLARL
jgi:YrbI family 3-deoxy-D-manno-octulosonate 8-phosphate phosphatase